MEGPFFGKLHLAERDGQVNWLLTFADSDLRQLTEQQIRGLIADFEWFSWTPTGLAAPARKSQRPSGHVEVPVLVGNSKGLMTSIRRAHLWLRKGLDALAKDEGWELPQYPRTIRLGVDPDTLQERDLDRRTMRPKHPFHRLTKVFVGTSVEVLFIARAAESILDEWPRLRLCKNPECRRLFLPGTRKQYFCSGECSNRKRWTEYRRRKKVRERDYAAEYDRRLELSGIPAKIIAERRRRKRSNKRKIGGQ